MRPPQDDQPQPAFSHRLLKSGDVEIRHGSHLAATLRGRLAAQFVTRIESASAVDAQRLMAQATGNYKRGNERRASDHPRNRR